MAALAKLGALSLIALLASSGPAPADDEPAAPRHEPSTKAQAKAPAKDEVREIPEAEEGGRVVKSEREWRRQLTPAQFAVTRMKGTEPAWSGKYARGKHHGTFVCVGCGAELFSSDHKYASGTGWPSFWRPIVPERLKTAPDYSDYEPRVEVECARCDAHLGHVFYDGPRPTGLRFCINSVALKLKPPTPAAKPKPEPEAGEDEPATEAEPAATSKEPAEPDDGPT